MSWCHGNEQFEKIWKEKRESGSLEAYKDNFGSLFTKRIQNETGKQCREF